MTMRMLSVSLLLCAVMALTAATTPTPPTAGEHVVVKRSVKRLERCPNNRWTLWEGNCYKFEWARVEWADAESRCLNQGGNLASIHSKDEHRFIQRLIRSNYGEMTQAWVGGYDATKNGLWLWSDGSKVEFTDWAKGEPNNGHGAQHCMVLNYSNLYLWDDSFCDRHHWAVCKITAC